MVANRDPRRTRSGLSIFTFRYSRVRGTSRQSAIDVAVHDDEKSQGDDAPTVDRRLAEYRAERGARATVEVIPAEEDARNAEALDEWENKQTYLTFTVACALLRKRQQC